MDKLKPILTHKFWILTGVTLVVAVVGWYLGTKAQAEAIEARIATLNGLNPANGATTPNESWIEKINVVKADRAEKVQTAADFLWSEQKDDMVWPTAMRPLVQDKTFNSDLDIQAQQTFRRIFDVEIEKLRRIVDPYDWNQNTMRMEGAVVLDRATLPLTDPASWQQVPPTSQEIWYLQEDVWLLGALLQAVRDVNDSAGADSNIIKAPIKQISQIELRGGDRAAMGAAAAGAGMSSGDPSMDAEMGGGMGYIPPGAEGMGGMSSGMDGMGGMGGGMGAGGPDFSMDEEVGPATLAATGMGMEGDMSSGDMSSSGMDAGYVPPADGGGAGFGMSGMGMGNQNPLLSQKRYVDDAPELPYKTRAFKLAVVMDHSRIPELLVELTNSPFPVNIERVHWVELNPSQIYPTNTGGMGGMSGMDGYAPPGEAGGGFGMSSGGGRGGAFGMSAPRPMPGLGRPGLGARGGSSMMPRPGLGGQSGFGGSMGARGGMGMSGRMPMGSMPGMEGMDGMDPYGGGFGAGQGGSDPYSQAMSDPFLAQVVIGGVMTIYRSPQDIQTAVADAAAGGDAATPAVETVPNPAAMAAPAEGMPPAAGATPADGAVPADGVAPADGAAPGAVPPGTPAPSAEGVAPAEGTPPTAGAAPANGTAPADAAAAPEGVPPTNTTDPAAGTPPATPDPGAAEPNAGTAPPAATEPPAADPAAGTPQ